MVYFSLPKDFKPKFKAVSCYLIYTDKILLLKRQKNKSQGGKWGPPAGKIEDNETPRKAVVREVFEESGIVLKGIGLKKLYKAFVVEDKYSFIWEMYMVNVSKSKVVIHNDEHNEFVWVTPGKALEYNLALDEDICIKKVFKI